MMGIPRAFPSVAAVIAMLQSVYITYNYKVVKHDHEHGALIIISNAVFGRACHSGVQIVSCHEYK